MQGQQIFQPKMFTNFRLDEHVPEDNFYRILKGMLDLNFIRKKTQFCYDSRTGRPSIDPVVFFKCLLIGYLENLCSDRAVQRNIEMRLDLRFFIDHDIDEKVPDHSTLCKTRQRIPTEVFEDVFNHILHMCIKAGLVKGTTQSIDSAYINANASLDKLHEIKLIERDPKEYLEELRQQGDQATPYGQSQEEQARKRLEKTQKHLEKHKEYREKKYKEQDGGKPQRKNIRRFFSNATHQSLTDPDARIAKKSGKPRMLCYSSMMAVDTENNVITHMSAERSHKKDSRYLINTVKQAQERLEGMGLQVENVLADAGFSSGENYATLEALGVDGFIPVHGTYKEYREGFEYNREEDHYTCSEGKILHQRQLDKSGGYIKKRYLSSKKQCDTCEKRIGCVGKRGYKEINHTIYKNQYDDMIERLQSEEGKESYGLRMHTVEPVFGTLQQHYGLRWINTRGLDLANKVMLMAACAVNLKKLVKKQLKSLIWAKISLSRTVELLITLICQMKLRGLTRRLAS